MSRGVRNLTRVRYRGFVVEREGAWVHPGVLGIGVPESEK